MIKQFHYSVATLTSEVPAGVFTDCLNFFDRFENLIRFNIFADRLAVDNFTYRTYAGQGVRTLALETNHPAYRRFE